MKKLKRIMATRALGMATRGTTRSNRLRRVDRWLLGTQSARIADASDPLIVDVGFGARPVTTLEMANRLRSIRDDLRVVGLEISPERLGHAQQYADPPRLEFAHGGFELGGRRPVLVRAFNVLREYDEVSAAQAWHTMCGQLAPGGLLVEGTSDEHGRLCSWIALDATGPLSLTLAAHLGSMERPSDLATRLPKALIHRNVAGEGVHAFIQALNTAWLANSSYLVFGPRQRWIATVEHLATESWPVVGTRSRWRLGEITVRWSAVQPTT